VDRFAKSSGQVLRAARKRRGLTLHDVWRISEGRFKPSALGGYERGERSISLDRFCSLAELYGVPADRVLGEILDQGDPAARRNVVVDLTALANLGEGDPPQSHGARALGEFIHSIRTRRGDFLTNVVSLRTGDLETFSMEVGLDPGAVLERLHAAIRDSDVS
jgi:transcriptional regulator with XRE-family HTH domain